MTYKEIEPFASIITYTNQRTILSFKKSKVLVGYFGGMVRDKSLRKQNKWKFVPTPQENNEKKEILISGDDLLNIQIINVW